MRTHVVRQGDHLERIAWEGGVSARSVQELEENAHLRERRDPNVLEPGDVVYLPDRRPPELTVTKSTTNKFVARLPRSRIEMTLRGPSGALSGAAFTVEGVPGPPIEGTTDGEGVARFDLPIHAEHAEVVVAEHCLRFRVRVGHLDPPETESGVFARLHQMGYLAGGPPGEDIRSAAALERAVRAFQTDRGIEATGELDQETRDALVERHGS